MDSEKITDHKMLSKFEEVFNSAYNTSGNSKLFGSKIPDGWFEYNDSLFIIENKPSVKKKSEGFKQVKKYYDIAKETEEFKKYKDCYLIVGCGTKILKYYIYSTAENEIKQMNKKLEDFKVVNINCNIFDQKQAHKFNECLRAKAKEIQMSSDAIFFVIAILLCRKTDPKLISHFDDKTDGFVIAEYLTKFIKDYYKDILFYKSFDFMKYNIKKQQLYDLIKMLDFDIKYYTNDVLNQFYSEFMFYNSKPKEGVVLTPHDIVELMVKELDIKKGESIMDCCTGTGSFLIEASKYTDNIIGCEIKEDLYTIAKSNFILHDLKTNKLFFNNCFNQSFDKYDHIILNPPYNLECDDNGEIKDIYGWRDFNIEQKFIIYQLQYLKENGTGCFIIPRNNFNNNEKKTNEFKNLLLKKCQILKIYNCNNKVFYPNAGIECIICVFKKCKSVEKYETEIIDYSNDGYDVLKNKRYKISEPKIKNYKEILIYDNDWNYQNIHVKLPTIQSVYYSLLNNEFIRIIKMYEIKEDYIGLSEKHKEFADKIDNLRNIKLKEWVEINIGEYFNIIKVGKDKIFQIKKSQSGIYPLISSSANNNGIAKFIDSYSIDIPECITVARNGTVGSCFYQSGKFAITTDVIILKLKKDKTLDLKIFSVLVTYFLTKKYSWSNKLSFDKLIEEIIYYPIVEFTD